MRLAIGNDHVAIDMKLEIKEYLESKGIEIVDVGTNSPERFNYPISGYKVAKLVASGEVDGVFSFVVQVLAFDCQQTRCMEYVLVFVAIFIQQSCQSNTTTLTL